MRTARYRSNKPGARADRRQQEKEFTAVESVREEVGNAAGALDVLRESQDRALHREGIPMFVGLADERPGHDVAPPGSPDSDRGAAVVARMEHYRAALAPQQRDTDMGVVISVLTVTAYEDFDRSMSWVSEPA